MTAPPDPRRRPAPWDPNDLVLLVALTLIAVSIIGVAWYGASGQGRLSQQTAWLNLAVVGIVVAGGGNLMWMARGRRSVGERRRALLTEWDTSVRASSTAAPKHRAPVGGALVRAAGMRFAHAPDCPLVAGKVTTPVAAGEGAPRCTICNGD